MSTLSTQICLLLLLSFTSAHASDYQRNTPQTEIVYILDFYSKRLEQDPVDFTALNRMAEAYVARARMLGDEANYIHAEALLRRSLSINSSRPNLGARSQMAAVLLARHRFQDAMAIADSVLVKKPDDPAALAVFGDARLEMGDLKGAKYIFRQLVRQSPNTASFSRLALLAQAYGDQEDAWLWFRLALDAANRTGGEPAAWVRVMMGDLAIKTGAYDIARDYCREALEIVPDYYLAYEHLAEIAEREEDYHSACLLLRKAIGISRQPELLLRLASVEEEIGHELKAQALREEAKGMLEHKVAAGDSGHRRALVLCLLELETDLPRALMLAEEDAAIRGGYKTDATLAQALAANGAVHRACVYMNRALQHNPLDPELYLKAGYLFERVGDLSASEAAYQMAQRINSRQ